jgi:hypothetical protein
MSKQKIDLEYVVKCSPKVLFNRLSSASGLSEWFADDVSVSGKIYTFIWNGAGQEAELVLRKENVVVRFDWVDDDTYFEFKITRDELTGDVSLLITDFADDDDVDEVRSLWDSQVTNLKHIVGS